MMFQDFGKGVKGLATLGLLAALGSMFLAGLGRDEAMAQCQSRHSTGTCAYALLR